MSQILIALIRAISKSYVKIGTLLDVRGFGVILISILLIVGGSDWLPRIVHGKVPYTRSVLDGPGCRGKTDHRKQSERRNGWKPIASTASAMLTGSCCDRARTPRPGLREVLMRVRASSLNYRDLMVLKGGGRGPTKLGVVPLSDGAGEVAAIGEAVTRVKSATGLRGRFTRAGLADLSGRITSLTGLAPISTGCWRNIPC
jgi:hypothetical protein